LQPEFAAHFLGTAGSYFESLTLAVRYLAADKKLAGTTNSGKFSASG